MKKGDRHAADSKQQTASKQSAGKVNAKKLEGEVEDIKMRH